ncbi:MAG: DUF2089 domain-containing protein [Acidimicrobiales bacterium]
MSERSRSSQPRHRPPRACPVCGGDLVLTRLGCPDCGSELAGAFEACEFCALSTDDRELLRLFLVSRGNVKELERQLGVSYPTARARVDDLLAKLGLRPVPESSRLDTLTSLASGDIDVDEAERRLT